MRALAYRLQAEAYGDLDKATRRIIRGEDGDNALFDRRLPEGFVTLLCREREMSAPQELSGRCDYGPPRGHRVIAKHALRLS